MTMLAPNKIAFIILLGTSMSDEGPQSQHSKCRNGYDLLMPSSDVFVKSVSDDWYLTGEFTRVFYGLG